MIVILHEISHISNINKFYTISCFPRRRSISWLQMAKNVFMKSFYLFYKVNWFFGHWTKLFTAKDMDTQETNYNYFKKAIFFHVKRQFSPVYFPFLFFVFFFLKKTKITCSFKNSRLQALIATLQLLTK